MTLHKQVCREVVQRVLTADKAASVLPEFGIRGEKGRRVNDGHGKSKPAKGPSHKIDVLVVLSNGACLAIEVDGASHAGKRAKKFDNRKARALRSFCVPLVRVDLRQGEQHIHHQLERLGHRVNRMLC